MRNLTQIRQIVRYLGASSGDMEKGAMRCEANISIRPAGSRELGTKVEVKNLNSFRAVCSAIAYEAERQQHIVESGGHVQQETMGWDERANVTRPQRSKETSDDYRYFPEPDLLVAELDDEVDHQRPHQLARVAGGQSRTLCRCLRTQPPRGRRLNRGPSRSRVF